MFVKENLNRKKNKKKTKKTKTNDLFLFQWNIDLNDAHSEKLCFTQFSTRMAAWHLLTFFHMFTQSIKGLLIWRRAGPARRVSSPRWDDFSPTFMWNLLPQFNQNVCDVAGRRLLDQVVFTINGDVKPLCWTNVLLLFNEHLKNKTKLIKEKSILSFRGGPLARVHMEDFHLA